MEALFCERPLVVSDIPQNREWVKDRRFGAIVPIGDAEGLAEAVESILQDPQAAAAKARFAAESARAAGDKDAGLGQAIRLYDRLLDRGPNPSPRAGQDA
jgi:glycosyltransferase involved in cell wall biosynthesis